MDAVKELGPALGIALTCMALGVARSTFYRSLQPRTGATPRSIDTMAGIRNIKQRWVRFREAFERARDPASDSLLPVVANLELWFGGGRPRKLFYFPKQGLVRELSEQGKLPHDWIVIVRYLVPTRESIEATRHLAQGFRLPIRFVGDLDALDLAIFAMLRAGTPDLGGAGARPLPVQYAGIDDSWLRLSEAHRISGAPLEASTWPMRDFERECWRTLVQLVPDLPDQIGPRCLSLLDSGKEVDIAIVSNLKRHDTQFSDRLVSVFEASPHVRRTLI